VTQPARYSWFDLALLVLALVLLVPFLTSTIQSLIEALQ